MRAKFGPRFFFMLTESLVEAFRTRLEALGFDLADLRIGGTPNRPLVQVRIDCPPRNVTVEDCSRVSRALEQWLDADSGSGGPLGKRYVLEVSSPGIERGSLLCRPKKPLCFSRRVARSESIDLQMLRTPAWRVIPRTSDGKRN